MQKKLLPEISEQSLATTLEIISDGIWDWNANTGYVYRSPGWYTMLGYNVDSLENTVFTWESVIHKDDFDRVMKHFDAYITRKSNTYNIEYRCCTKQGDYIWIEDRGKVVEWNEDGSVARMIGAHRYAHDEKLLLEQLKSQNKTLEQHVAEHIRELTRVNAELKQKVQEAERLATTDALTSVANRYQFEKTLSHEVERAHRFNQSLSLISIDIDEFKEVNDEFGHATGDLVLVKLTKLISETIREIDLIARWGGDELMVILPHTALAEAKVVAEKLQGLIAETTITDKLKMTCSFGVAELQKDETAMSLSIRADNALYKSKTAGRNAVYS